MAHHRITKADLYAALVGVAMAVLFIYAVMALMKLRSWGECHGESTPYIGSGRQAHVTPYCLAKDEGPLIGVKKRLGIYDPGWKIVIK